MTVQSPYLIVHRIEAIHLSSFSEIPPTSTALLQRSALLQYKVWEREQHTMRVLQDFTATVPTQHHGEMNLSDGGRH